MTGPRLRSRKCDAMRRLLLALLIATSVAAQDKAKPDTPEQAADKVLAAFKAKDEAALKALAEKDQPDPWLVADELCYRGECRAADLFARAVPGKDGKKLTAYVTAAAKRRPNATARQAYRAAAAPRHRTKGDRPPARDGTQAQRGRT